MTTKTIGIYSAPAAIRLPELASERLASASSKPSLISIDYNGMQAETAAAPIKRYEETRQFVVQDCTHHRIMKVGHDVHHRLSEVARSQQHQAVKEGESRVRQEMQRATEKRLADLEKQLAMQHEFKIARLKQEHERIIQEKILETETAMRKDLIEAVEKEREDGKRRLKEKEDELNAWWTAEAERQVTEAREEERAIAAREKQTLLEQHKRQTVELKAEEKRIREAALAKLEAEKNAELVRELLKARDEERRIREDLQQQMQLQLEKLTAEAEAKEAELLAEIEAVESAHASTRQKRAAAEEELIRIYQEFETFIDRVLRLNTGGEGAFLLPYTDFLRGVVDAKDAEKRQQQQQQLESRRTSIGTVTLQRVQLPSNVRLVTDFP
ncbi:hypothetical protein BOX15_Mlig017565g1 [Macrostomum lignano]|uniref:Uncharacterized protein n=1 Tax=Macrostomum lignano TaxID=282301 RepID=A0A267HAG1_9PLAT|nr:hypothetical protein BOX15_Mlig017565g1 [Macrostomum lignano]